MSKAKSLPLASTRFSSQEGIIGGTNPPSRTLTFSTKPKIHARIRHFLSLANSKKHFFSFLQINLLKKAPRMAPFMLHY